MARRTKIVATIGPASDSADVLRAMVAAGMDVARVSLAHGPVDEACERIGRVRQAAAAEGRVVAVLADLPGPKVRAAPFGDDGVPLAPGDVVELVPAEPGDRSARGRIAVDLPSLLDEVQEGDRVALGDGGITLEIAHVDPSRAARATVITGGTARGRPGVALPASRSRQASPTPYDLSLLDPLVEADVDYIAISFVRTPGDIARARAAIAGRGPLLVAKIETQEAVDGIEAIIAVSDGVMVARGDLGIRCALEDVPHHQKHIIRHGVAYGRPVITATQMLESMIQAPVPTRAEVSDVANAVFDGTSALMLSAETAVGHDPVLAVRTMAQVAERAEREFDYEGWGRNLGRQQSAHAAEAPPAERITSAISAAGWRAAVDAGVAAIVVSTRSGATARAISRYRPRMPLLAATPSERTSRHLAMAWGVTPMLTEVHETTDEIVWFAVQRAASTGVIKQGDVVAVLVGSPTDPDPATDTLRLVRVR